MRKTKWQAICGVALALASAAASAAYMVVPGSITASGPGSVHYVHFSIDIADTLTIYTRGPSGLTTPGPSAVATPFDPVLYLFRDDGSLDAGDLITFNDDGCSLAICGPAISFSNSIVTPALTAGSYLTAVSDFAFSAAEAVSGLNANSLFGSYELVIESRVANISVPEPSVLALLGGVLLLAPLARARRRR
jgi:hypothetical protein